MKQILVTKTGAVYAILTILILFGVQLSLDISEEEQTVSVQKEIVPTCCKVPNYTIEQKEVMAYYDPQLYEQKNINKRDQE